MLKNILLLITTLAATTFLFEIVARRYGFEHIHFYSGKIVKYNDYYNKKINYDTDYDWVKDNSPIDQKKVIRINYKNYLIKKEENTKRVLFIGDSATFGNSIDRSKRFASLLENELKDKAQFINAAIPGFDNLNQLTQLDQKLIKLSPDIIVWQIFMANDLNMNILESHTPDYFSYITDSFFGKSALVNLVLTYLKHFNLDTKLGLKSKFKSFETRDENIRFDEFGYDLSNFPEGEFSLYHKFETKTSPLIYSKFSEITKRIKSISIQNNAKLIVLIVPTRSSIINDLKILPDLKDAKKYFNKDQTYYDENIDYSYPTKRVTNILKSMNIHFYNPTYEIQKGIREDFFSFNDDHPSEIGHRMYYNYLLKYLESNL